MDHGNESAYVSPAFHLNVRPVYEHSSPTADLSPSSAEMKTNASNGKGCIVSCLSGMLHVWHLQVACIQVECVVGQNDCL